MVLLRSFTAAAFGVPLLSLLSTVRAAPLASLGLSLGSPTIRGVNLGGWLVLEPWINPSLFENTNDEKVVDEWTFSQKPDAKLKLKNHWDTWITEQDLKAIADAGLNHVRIPIGYWAFEVGPGEPYISGQLPYLEKAVEWAGKYGLKVVVDLHGAPGSQNGFDNSGQRRDPPTWHSNSTNVDRTNRVMKTIADKFKDSLVVTVITPLNEPATFKDPTGNMMEVVKQYWQDSYTSVRNKSNDKTVLIHDAFQPPENWGDFMTNDPYHNVMMDTHIYQMFSPNVTTDSDSDHITKACSQSSYLQKYKLPAVVGEWTPAMTDCAKYLNGRGVGARYDGSYDGSPSNGKCKGKTGVASTFTSDFKVFLRKMWEAQVIAFEKGGQGWLMWTWKTEIAHEWSYKAGLENGWIPTDPTDLKYKDICDTA